MDQPDIKIAGAAETQAVMAVLTLAFAADPFMRWLFPEPDDFLKGFVPFTLAISGKAFEGNTAFYLQDYSAAALWLAPGVRADEEEMITTLLGVLPESRHEALAKLGEALDVCHPQDPHWYLADIGVDAAMQGRGRGALMMKDMLRRCDEEKTIAYLESSNPRNVPFYERHGFEVTGQVNVGNPEPMTPMIRTPRR